MLESPRRLLACLAVATVVATGCGGDETPDRPSPAAPLHLEASGATETAGQAIAVGRAGLYLATDGGLHSSSDEGTTFSPLAAVGLPRGHVNVLTALGSGDAGQPDTLLAYVWGKGLYRSDDGGATFVEQPPLPTYGLLEGFITPRAQVVPFGTDVDPDDPDHAVIAGLGGLYKTNDAGETFELLEPSIVPGQFLLFWFDADVRGDTIVAAAQSPSTLLPPNLAGLVARGVVISRDDGATWEDISGDLPAKALTGVAIAEDGTVFAAAMDGGAFRYDGEGRWTALGGPSDATNVAAHGEGITVGSGTRGLWRWEPSGWSQIGEGATVSVEDDHALTYDGTVYRLVEGQGQEPPEPSGGTVFVALSFHVNLYHSYRGDTNDEDGYGLDIEVIRTILDWLADYPEVHADWDMDNAFSTDDWLAQDAPDILADVSARVAEGQDDVRLMSWNNGAMSASTFEEFEQAVERAKVSNTAAFGEHVPGVQPQENMFHPDHVGWYRQLGIEWITLFNSMSPFTGFPLDVALDGIDNYAPLTLEDGDDSMTLVPVYNHADVFDHGGMKAWAQQLSDAYSGDVLLVIHFDADSETWLSFDGELADLQGLDFVRYTTIQDYLDEHDPTASITLEGDQADGIGDGYQSWAEKDINHEVFTQAVRSRSMVDWARALAPADPAVVTAAEASLTQRLLTLSTTNFGLASPYLHPDREVAARAFAQQSLDDAAAALAAAELTSPVAPGTIELVNTRPSAGPALVEIDLEVAAATYTDPAPLAVFDGGVEIPIEVGVVDVGGDPIVLRATAVVDLPAASTKTLTWTYDPNSPSTATGRATTSDVDPSSLPLVLPFTECFGSGQATATVDETTAAVVDARGLAARLTEQITVPFCEATGTASRTFAVYDGLPGTEIRVDAVMGTPADDLLAESVALTPLACTGDVTSITWQSFGGTVRTRRARVGQETWNGQAADGWLAYACDDGEVIQIAHRVLERTSIAFSPLRNDDGVAIFAPLGTLWGDTPWHFGRRIGGHGAGDLVGIITPQFNPTAPDWSGKEVRYRLLVGSGIDEAVLDLFAHPPLVRAGTYLAP